MGPYEADAANWQDVSVKETFRAVYSKMGDEI